MVLHEVIFVYHDSLPLKLGSQLSTTPLELVPCKPVNISLRVDTLSWVWVYIIFFIHNTIMTWNCLSV